MPRFFTTTLMLLGMMTGNASAQPANQAESTSATPVFADTVWLDNGTINLGVSPSVGRITWFGFSGDKNLLWVNPETVDTPPDGNPAKWINYGGDKVWPSPQALWKFFYTYSRGNWPPDGELDGEAWHLLEHTDRRVTLVSPSSSVIGVRVLREIQIDDETAAVSIRNEIQRDAGSPMPAQVWSVSQVLMPEAVALGTSEVAGGPNPFFIFGNEEKVARFDGELSEHPGYVQWTWADENPVNKKRGALGNWIAARYGDTALVQVQGMDPQGMYPENSNVQLYVGEGYIELETLGPAVPLRAHQTTTHRVSWLLVDLDEQTGWEAYLEQLQRNPR